MKEHKAGGIKETLNRPDPTAKPTDKRVPTIGDDIGEGVGGLSGAATGLALGSLGGPIGMLIGGIAGAAGGWWAGREVSAAADRWTDKDDAHFRAHHTRVGAKKSYEEERALYQLGHVASEHPEYRTRRFEDIEPEMQRGWGEASRKTHGEWTDVRDRVRAAFERRRQH